MIGWQDALAAAERDADEATLEADIRRALSGLYYALFHRLSAASASTFVAAGPQLQSQARRAISHTVVRKVCDTYERAGRLGRFDTAGLMWMGPPSPGIVTVAAGFAYSQDFRVTADYDLAATVSLSNLLDALKRSVLVHDRLDRLAATPELATFLAALLLHDRWTRRG